MTARPAMKTVALAGCLLLVGCAQPLLQDLPEAEANELVTELGRAGLRGTKGRGSGGRFQVLVSPRDARDAWRVAKAAGFPRAPESSAPQRLVLGPTEATTLARQRKAAGLAALLRQRETVVDAQVVLAPAGAAVLIRSRPRVEIDRAAIIEAVRAGAGLGSDAKIRVDVSIIDHGVRSKSALAPRWPLQLAIGSGLCLAVMCLLLVVRLRRARRQQAEKTGTA